MNVLSDEEIDAITDAQWGKQGVGAMYAACRAFARAIEAAVIAKLTAGVSVEPSYHMTFQADGVRVDTPYYTPDQLQTAIAAARLQALEEAAKICDEDQSGRVSGGYFAYEIRALKETP